MTLDVSENVQAIINKKMATGKYATMDELLLHALDALSDYHESVSDIRAGLEDEAAGHVRTIAQVGRDIREELGFSK